MKKHNNTRGFTLVEIAIVLVIIGLLLGGILKGQELINNAKVRAIADRQNSLKVAWFSFQDRYQGIPGDFPRASQFIPGVNSALTGPGTGSNGNGDGILGTKTSGAAITGLELAVEATESVLAMQHLTGAGYLRCPQCTAQEVEEATAINSLTNSYGGTMMLLHTDAFYDETGVNLSDQARLAVLTGGQMPSNILSEVDRKIDDGNPFTGDFVFSPARTSGVGITPPGAKASGTCAYTGNELWNSGQDAAVQPNCGAVVFI